ncbi:peptidoglycan-binding protein [Paracoccus sp. Z330]|uniref:Peptidoglycan-binding protein n=1 Tax=Paracoccus onchidii TaxID=3017813 RepID=A0ABT4ZA10_9RHOB|nr:peptidoglycan-binding protein [Paracoccus onchidii]MDB6176184.1 peptidoglycan-binding protein [Paracoccus onchidii]
MTDRLRAAALGALIAILPATADAQTLLETYRAEIAPVDRRNSSGTGLTDIGAILAQDRANVHRFGHRQPGDTVDATFSSRKQRAAMGSLLARGSISQAAARALRDGGTVLKVEVWSRGGKVSHVTVDVAPSKAAAGGDPGDPLLTASEMDQNAARIQAALNNLGFDAGPVDGQGGRQTQEAVLAFQRSLGRPATGTLTRSEWKELSDIPSAIGPSFECARAATPTEQAICADPALAALDRVLGDAWTAQRQVDNSDSRLAEQRIWLAERDACNDDVACLQASMKGRLSVLGGELPATSPGLAAATDGTAQVAETGAAMAVSAEGGLVTVNGRILYSPSDLGRQIVPLLSSLSVQDHEQEWTRRLAYTQWIAGSDDLEKGLAGTRGTLRRYFDLLPRDAQDEIVQFGLSASGMTDSENNSCFKNTRASRYSCAAQNLPTEFDRRRFQQVAATIVARTAKAEQLDLPIAVRAFCPLGPIDRAYDFDTSTVDWAWMIANGCHLNQPDTDLAAAVPQRSKMDAARVEDLARRYIGHDAQGQGRLLPLMLAFDAELSVARNPNGRAGPDGLTEVSQSLRRTGPVELRWSGAPQEVVLQFEAPTGNLPSEAVDLRQGSPAFRLFETAPEMDATRLKAALRTPASSGDGVRVRLPAWPTADQGPARLSVANFFIAEEPARQIAAQTDQPLEHVAWTQLSSRERGVPDTELVLIFPAPYASVESEPIDPALTQGRNQEDVALLGRISEPMQMEGSAGPALVAIFQPEGFEITESGIGGARQVVARPVLAASKAAANPQNRVFLPTPWWFAAQAAELQGQDIDTYLNAAMDRANLHRSDTFARLDALAAAKTAIEQVKQAKEEAPWVAGRITLGAYDLERKAWPVNGLQLVLPTQDSIEAAVARRVQPKIDTKELFIPMSVDDARAFEAARRRSGPLDFYARVDISAPSVSDHLAVQAHMRELLLFPLEGSPSQQMNVSHSFDRETAIARLEFDPPPKVEAMDSQPVAKVAPSPVAALDAVSQTLEHATGTAPPPVQNAPAVSDDDWPELPDLTVAKSDWDLLGLHTGMTLPEAEAVIEERGGLLAVLERPIVEPDTAQVRSTLYQRMYVAAEGTEAITLAAPGPEGPVLAILRRLQLPRGDLPFDTIQQTLIEKYGAPSIQDDSAAGERMYWFDGTPGAAQAICRTHFPRRVAVSEWQVRDGGDGSPDLSKHPAPWDWAITDMPVDYAEQASTCGRVLTFEPEGVAQQGGAAFSMILVDLEALRMVDETLADVPAAEKIEIEF